MTKSQLNQIHLRPSNGPICLLSRDKDKQCGTVNRTKQRYDGLKRVINPNKSTDGTYQIGKKQIL
jgi:hypothetical protein